MTNKYSKISWIKKNQKESLLYKEISQLFQMASLDIPDLAKFHISRVALSDDKSNCYVYFFSDEGETLFKEHLHKLKLYKPSLRKALANKINARRVPQIIFKYDDKYLKQKELDELLESVRTDK